jgi:hypothetical protein
MGRGLKGGRERAGVTGIARSSIVYIVSCLIQLNGSYA